MIFLSRRRKFAGVLNWTVIGALIAYCSGCQQFSSFTWSDLTKPRVELPPPPPEKVFRAGHWEEEPPPPPGTLAGDLASARVLFQRGQYDDAEKVFSWIADRAEREKEPGIFEEALYWLGEAQFAQRKFPAARSTYKRLLDKFPNSRYRSDVIRREVEIAENWLEDTREELRALQEGRWYFPKIFHFEKEKPLVGAESSALSTLQDAYLQDPTGPLAPHCLDRIAAVSFLRQEWEEADRYYTLLTENHPRSPLASAALRRAIEAKINSVPGPEYDDTKLAEARQLIDTALRKYPELRNPESQAYFQATLAVIHDRQAQKDFNIAEFYRRTGLPGSAYFYYELVRRRYSGTRWAQLAEERIQQLREQVEKSTP
ncbi:MAG: tetratricopeptide repeat protein [Gemmatales bacterium]|nr:tetratricopeptide repeat protein [Gemmatales bacterium]MDW7994756.1 tetratricopeptide repeat protein [Gemmatales bacterium]